MSTSHRPRGHGGESEGMYVGITEASRLTGRTIKTLRRWEREGLLVPDRDVNGRRRYSEQHLARCKEIVAHSRVAMHRSKKLQSVIPLQLSLFGAEI